MLLHGDGLDAEQTARALLTPCACVEDALAELAARSTTRLRIGIMPLGPQAIPEAPAR